MTGFCASCGGPLNVDQRFCPKCGAAVQLAPEPPIEADPAPIESTRRMSPRTRSLLIGAGIPALVGSLIALIVVLNRSDSDPALTQPEATVAASEDPNAPRPQAWFDNYTDKFLSAEIERLTIGAAQKRSFPTAKGGAALGPVARGTLVKGRWVEGGDPKTRWLKTADGGYVWEGNLGDPQQITALGMNGFVAGSSFSSVRDRIDPEGHYGSQDPDMDTNACETYSSLDGLVSIMVVEGKVSRIATDNERLETGRGIRVGSSERELQRAYSNQLKREPNVYDGTDYYLWTSKDRGIRFLVNEGKVTWITSGDETIRYVEGCL